MNEANKNQDQLDNIYQEIELKKMKLSLETGGKFCDNDKTDLPPEVENEWLDHIQKFEDAHRNSTRVKLYDFIGRPEFRETNSVPATKLRIELDRIMEVLSNHKIQIDAICEVNDRDMYRFIVEELFEHEMDDIRIEGLVLHFIYEEFHPNHMYDLEKYSTKYLEIFFNKARELDSGFLYLAQEFNSLNGKIKLDELLKKINLFRDAYCEFVMQEYSLNFINYDATCALVNFEIMYEAKIEGSNWETFRGTGEFTFEYDLGYWLINQINIPGLEI